MKIACADPGRNVGKTTLKTQATTLKLSRKPNQPPPDLWSPGPTFEHFSAAVVDATTKHHNGFSNEYGLKQPESNQPPIKVAISRAFRVQFGGPQESILSD